jgi:hypothetical protein
LKRSRVVVLGSNAALRVRGGALEIEHGPARERIKVKIDIDDRPPCAVLFDGRGEFITGETIRFCARHAINIVLPNGPGRAILFTESALEAADSNALNACPLSSAAGIYFAKTIQRALLAKRRISALERRIFI